MIYIKSWKPQYEYRTYWVETWRQLLVSEMIEDSILENLYPWGCIHYWGA